MPLGRTMVKRRTRKSPGAKAYVAKKTKEIVDHMGMIIKDGYAVGPVDAARWYYQRLQDRGCDLLPVENGLYPEFIAALVVFSIQKDRRCNLDTNCQKLVQYSVISELNGINKNHIIL